MPRILLNRPYILAISVLAFAVTLLTYVWTFNFCCGLLCPWYFVFCGIVIVLPILLIVTLIQFIKKRTGSNLISVLLIIASMLVFFGLPSLRPTVDQRFVANRTRYEKAVNYVIANIPKYQEGVQYFEEEELPDEYKGLSKCSNPIAIDEQASFTQAFFVNSTDWRSVSGYLYSSDDRLHDSNFIYLAELEEVCRKIEEHWYFCDYND